MLAKRSVGCGAAVLALCFAGLAPEAQAWDEKAHRAIARIAQDRLADNAQRRQRFLLGVGSRLEDLTYWAETIYAERPDTESWHSITIPPNATRLDMKRDCILGDCVTVKLREMIGIVRLSFREKEQQIEALKFLLSLMGNLHQPLNAGYPPGFGAGDEPVLLDGREMTLHEVWDSALFEDLDGGELEQRIRRRITPEKVREWEEGTIKDWTWETHLVAVRVAYGALPKGSPKRLTGEYLDQARAAAEEQLAKAAVRLGMTLNECWP